MIFARVAGGIDRGRTIVAPAFSAARPAIGFVLGRVPAQDDHRNVDVEREPSAALALPCGLCARHAERLQEVAHVELAESLRRDQAYAARTGG
jgi:hypothetical protein